MNLPGDVIKVLALDAEGRVNGPIDDEVRIADEEPELKTDWLESLLRTVFEVIVLLIQFAIACFMLIVAFATGDNIAVSLITSKLMEYGLNLLITIGQALMVLLQAAIKGALMVWIYIQLAIFLISTMITFNALLGMTLFLSLFSDKNPIINFLYISFYFFNYKMEYEANIEWIYYKPLDIEIPTMLTSIFINEILFFNKRSDIVLPFEISTYFKDDNINLANTEEENLLLEKGGEGRVKIL